MTSKVEQLQTIQTEMVRILTRLEARYAQDFRARCPNCLEKGWCYRGQAPTFCKCRECELAELQEALRNPSNPYPSQREQCLMATTYGGLKPCELTAMEAHIAQSGPPPKAVAPRPRPIFKDISV